jgi:two-component system cell cycle response regulator DivK
MDLETSGVATLIAQKATVLPAPSHPFVLAIDDDADSLDLLRQTLDLFGLPNVSSSSAIEALRLIRKQRPSLILLDIIMPDVSGLDVVAYVRHCPDTQDIPVVAITALAKPEDRQMLLQMGCNDYLNKPYSLDDLEAILTRYLNLEHSELTIA